MLQMGFGYPQFALVQRGAQVMSKAYLPCRSADKTNWYACLAQLKHTVSPDRLGQDRQCTKAIGQYLKIKATRSPKIPFQLPTWIMFALFSLIYQCFPV